MDWDKVIEEFRGKDKVESIKIDEIKKGKKTLFRYHFKEKVGKKMRPASLDFTDRAEADKFHLEFGGKNVHTVAAQDEFLNLKGLSSEMFFANGHDILKIYIEGTRQTRSLVIPIRVPNGCGFSGTGDSAKIVKPDDEIFKKITDKETIRITRSFKENKEFDELVDFLYSNEQTAVLEWTVKKMVTFAHDEKKDCLWLRSIAADGTKRMVLELLKINNMPYEDCLRNDVFGAADGMVGSECQKIPDMRKKVKQPKVCKLSL